MLLDLFAEDQAHESLIGALIKRIAEEEGVQTTCRTRSARGGHARAIREFRLYQRFISSSRLDVPTPDLIVVAIDTNCSEFSKSKARSGKRRYHSTSTWSSRRVQIPTWSGGSSLIRHLFRR